MTNDFYLHGILIRKVHSAHFFVRILNISGACDSRKSTERALVLCAVYDRSLDTSLSLKVIVLVKVAERIPVRLLAKSSVNEPTAFEMTFEAVS